jgi:hypothetical protein
MYELTEQEEKELKARFPENEEIYKMFVNRGVPLNSYVTRVLFFNSRRMGKTTAIALGIIIEAIRNTEVGGKYQTPCYDHYHSRDGDKNLAKMVMTLIEKYFPELKGEILPEGHYHIINIKKIKELKHDTSKNNKS